MRSKGNPWVLTIFTWMHVMWPYYLHLHMGTCRVVLLLVSMPRPRRAAAEEEEGEGRGAGGPDVVDVDETGVGWDTLPAAAAVDAEVGVEEGVEGRGCMGVMTAVG
jgi:hypothetical protein